MFPRDSKIMVVDDSAFSRTMLKQTLVELGHLNLVEAADAVEAQRLMLHAQQKDAPVHLLMLDIHMPDVNGLDFLRWVRLQQKTRDLPTIILTASQERREVLEAAAIGVSQYVIKPYDAAVLKHKMLQTWKRHGEKYLKSLQG